MGTKVSRPKGPYLPAKNNRLVSVGQRNLEALHHNNRQNVVNAISATGYPITLYNTLRQGIKCSCMHVQQPSNEILDTEGKLSERDMVALLEPSSGMLDYGGETFPSQNLQTVNPVKRIELNNTAKAVLNPSERPSQTQADHVDTHHGRLVDDWNDLEMDTEFDEVLTPERFMANQGRACAVCFGTGYVGGYELLHGTRIVLTPLHQHERSGSVTLDRNASPNAFDSLSDGWVRFEVVLPRGSEYALFPRLFNNTQAIPYREWRLVDNEENELTPNRIKELCVGKSVLIELRVGKLTFTHLELILSGRPANQPMKADSPEIQTLTDVNRMDAKTPVTWIVGGTYNISKRAIVIDHLPGMSRHWRVNDIQARRDNLNWIYEATLSSRLVDLYELTQLLRPVRYETAPLD